MGLQVGRSRDIEEGKVSKPDGLGTQLGPGWMVGCPAGKGTRVQAAGRLREAGATHFERGLGNRVWTPCNRDSEADRGMKPQWGVKVEHMMRGEGPARRWSLSHTVTGAPWAAGVPPCARRRPWVLQQRARRDQRPRCLSDSSLRGA